MSQQETENGIKWLEGQVSAIADELDIRLDRPPEWETGDPLNFKMAVEVAGRREILTLWRPHIDDCQGGNNQPTREVQAKLAAAGLSGSTGGTSGTIETSSLKRSLLLNNPK